MRSRRNGVPDLKIEGQIAAASGARLIAGLDESGRGALAGPVVAAAVILPRDQESIMAALLGVDDSKRLTPRARAEMEPAIQHSALAWAVGTAPPAFVDQEGVMAATRLAMAQAIAGLQLEAEFLIIDGRVRLPRIPLPQQSFIRGDQKSLSIAAASILAKMARDRQMVREDGLYPAYGFAQHKGYGTRQHLVALESFGPCPIHRLSFAPLRPRLQ